VRELLTLKQTSSVEEYKKQFDKLVYQIRLYDSIVGGMMLVQRFILGLKEELRAVVEVQLPDSVAEAASFAIVQEAVLERQKHQSSKGYNRRYNTTSKKEKAVSHHRHRTNLRKENCGEPGNSKITEEQMACASSVGRSLLLANNAPYQLEHRLRQLKQLKFSQMMCWMPLKQTTMGTVQWDMCL
jgi:hypothetical protein